MTATPLISSTSETEAGGTIGFQPETPFLPDGAALVGLRTAPLSPVSSAGSLRVTESPFVAEYAGGSEAEDARTETFADLMGELHDEEFEEAVTDLVHEASALAEERFGFEAGSPEAERIEAERGVRDYLEPLAQECEATVDRLIQGVGSTDLTTMTEAELEAFLDRFAPAPGSLPPTLEQFGGSFFKKIKKAVKGAVGLAKKGLALATKLSPVHLLLGKLKRLVRPLLERVLRFAINKIPASLRPIAKQLASRLLGVSAEAEGTEGEDEGEAAAEDPAMISKELDTRIAGYTLEGEDFERQMAMEEFGMEQESGGGDPWRELQSERARFAQDVMELEEGEDPAPVVERFVPAILAALRLGIKVIGRPRVVNFLAGLLAQLIGKYVGKEQAVPLSRALVDSGLKLVSLESPGEATLEAGYTLASTLEDTVSRVAQEAPEAAWENEAVLESYVRDAFQEAASAHFPDALIRPDLHESSQTSGVWVLLPAGTRRRHYKKYTRIMDVTVTPQMAAALKSFGGVPVKGILRDQLALPAGQAVTARVHLYEALAGSTLPDIAMHEKSVRGLGSSRRESWSLIHPLTPEAASILFKEPGLGRQVDPKFLADRNHITVGQRFYYLEIAGARPRLIISGAGRRAARVSQTSLVIDFPKSAVRIFLFFSEAEAQALSAQLRGRAPIGTLLTTLKAGLDARLQSLLSGVPTRSVRIIHEAVPAEHFSSPMVGAAVRLVGRPLRGLLIRWVLEALRRELDQRGEQFAAHFTRAAAAEADGVTVAIEFRQPSFMAPLRGLLSRRTLQVPPVAAGGLFRQAVGDFAVTIHPGFARS